MSNHDDLILNINTPHSDTAARDKRLTVRFAIEKSKEMSKNTNDILAGGGVTGRFIIYHLVPE